ncbi:MAG: rhodanese-like domain-containing protein [Vampirovibrio sp.]
MIKVIKAEDIHANELKHIIDVRSRDEYLQEHIPQSLNIPLNELPNYLNTLRQMESIIVSCRSGQRANRACLQLEQLHLNNLQLLEGGLNGWKSSGRETVSLKKGFSIMQQVQMIVGVMVLTGILYPPLWFLGLIAGTGMLVAGLTNTCMMARILGHMPWNKGVKTESCSIR